MTRGQLRALPSGELRGPSGRWSPRVLRGLELAAEIARAHAERGELSPRGAADVAAAHAWVQRQLAIRDSRRMEAQRAAKPTGT